MAGNPINSTAINASGVLATIVAIPPGISESETILYERGSPYLAGEITSGFVTSGDLAKIRTLTAPAITIDVVATGTLSLSKSILLSGSTGMDITTTATLSGFRYLPYGESISIVDVTGSMLVTKVLQADLAWGLDSTATLINKANIGDATADVSLDATGSLTVRQQLSGATAMSTSLTGELLKTQTFSAVPMTILFGVTGDLTLNQCIPKYFDPTEATMGIETTGNLRATLRMPGTTDWGIDLLGEMTKIIAMEGTTTFGLDVSGDLANNAYGLDLAKAIMVRRKTNREMIR